MLTSVYYSLILWGKTPTVSLENFIWHYASLFEKLILIDFNFATHERLDVLSCLISVPITMTNHKIDLSIGDTVTLVWVRFKQLVAWKNCLDYSPNNSQAVDKRSSILSRHSPSHVSASSKNNNLETYNPPDYQHPTILATLAPSISSHSDFNGSTINFNRSHHMAQYFFFIWAGYC